MNLVIDEKDKRALILYGAMKVFSRKGFHEAKVEEIAQEAGVGKGTVYEYFSSKEELFKEMIQAGLNKFILTLTTEVNQAGSIREKLGKMFLISYQFANRYKENMGLFLEMQRGIKEDIHKLMFSFRNDQIKLVEAIILEGIRLNELRPVNANLAAQVFLGSIKSVTSCFAFGEELQNPEKTFEEAIDILFKGLQK